MAKQLLITFALRLLEGDDLVAYNKGKTTSDCFCAETVFKMFQSWIFNYNHVAPHSGLGMKSPVEYKDLLT